MFKGIRKNIYFMKCDRNSPFESAMFILKEKEHTQPLDCDIIAEAEKLVACAFSDCNTEKPGKAAKRKKTK